MKMTHVLVTILLAAAPAALVAQTAKNPATTQAAVTDPGDFAARVASANMFEIVSSKLALQHSIGPKLTAFAQKMVGDHTHAGAELTKAATDSGVTPPVDMAATDKAAMIDLKGAANFQSAYVAAQVKGHDETVALFESFMANGPAGPLKDFATKTLPTLKDHQSAIHAIAGI